MPVKIHGSQMERGPDKWSVVTSGLEGSGPLDKTLIVSFDGDPGVLAGFNGNFLDIAKFRQSCVLARQDWIPAEGTFHCSVLSGMPLTIKVSFN